MDGENHANLEDEITFPQILVRESNLGFGLATPEAIVIAVRMMMKKV